MAVLKIYQVKGNVKEPQVPQTSALTLPLGLATNYGRALSSVGKELTNIFLENKAEEDANEASDIISVLNQKISETYNKYGESTSTKDVLNFSEELKSIDYEASNKEVKKLVNKYLRKQNNTLSLNLGKKILKNSNDLSRSNKDDEINQHILDITSTDGVRTIIGTREYNNFFSDPKNILFYGEAGIKKLKKEKDQLLLKNIFIKRIDAGDIDLTDPKVREEIFKEFGELGGKELVERARAKTYSDVLTLEKQDKNNDINRVEQQLNNFTFILNNINSAKGNPDVQVMSLDDIFDRYQEGALNSAQYNALIKYYADPNKLSDQSLVELVNVQIAASSTITDFDDLQKALNEDTDILDKLNPEDVEVFSKIIDKYKGDVLGMTDYKKYQELLKTHVKDVSNVMSFIKTSDGADAKIKSINATQEYNRHILNGSTPEDAYLKLISGFTKNDLPKPDQLPQPYGISITSLKEIINKNADTAFDNLRKKSVELYNNGTLNLEEYKENISRLDKIEDVLKIRKDIFGGADDKYLGSYKIKKQASDGKEEETGNSFTDYFKNILGNDGN